MTRVLLVDDHPVFRRGLAVLLAASGYDVVGEAASGAEAIEAADRLSPDIVLMDLGLPELGGARTTERILAEHPGIRVVVITMFDDAASVAEALDAGALGYVVKDSPPEEIIAAIRAAELGASMLGSGIARPSRERPVAHPDSGPFTPRELEVAALLAKGLSNRTIGERLGVSGKTVANYVANVRLKLGAETRYEAAERIRQSQA